MIRRCSILQVWVCYSSCIFRFDNIDTVYEELVHRHKLILAQWLYVNESCRVKKSSGLSYNSKRVRKKLWLRKYDIIFEW